MNGFDEWPQKDLDLLAQKCSESKYSYAQIGAMMGRTSASCRSKAARLGFGNQFSGKKKYFVNDNFWVPNPISCYWAGFSAADGCIRKHSPNAHGFAIQLSNKDHNHLEKFKEDSGFTGPIKLSLREEKHLHCSVYVSSNKWAKDLSKHYNIIPNKTERLAPPNELHEYLKWSYLTGYLDGDGCLCFAGDKNEQLVISAISSSFEIIKWCKDLIFSRFELVRVHNKNIEIKYALDKYPKIAIGGLRAVAIYDFLNKFPLPKLARKWQNPELVAHLEEVKLKHPQVFIDNETLYQSILKDYENSPKIEIEPEPVDEQFVIEPYVPNPKYHTGNKEFWNVQNDTTCYWAGFVAGGSTVEKNTEKSFSMRLNVMCEDHNHLVRFTQDCGFTGKVNSRKARGEGKQPRSVLDIACLPWRQSLKDNFNIQKDKSQITVPKFKNEYLEFCYLIGLFDSNGSIGYREDKLEIRLSSHCIGLMPWAHSLIFDNFGHIETINSSINKMVSKRNGKTLFFQITGLRAAVLYDFISKFQLPKLERLWNRPEIFNYIQKRKTNHKNFFDTSDSLYNSLKNQYNNS